MIFFFLILTPSFNTNDDVGMMFIANGTYYGNPSEHLVFTKVIIGLVLKLLYTVMPGIPWYTAYLYFFHFIACSLIIYSLICLSRNALHFSVLLYTFIVFEIILLLNLQFTSTSLLLGFSSILYYLTLTKQKQSVNWVPIIAGILLGTAGVIREKSFWGVLAFNIPLLLYGVRCLPWRKTVLFGLSALCVFWGASFTNNLYYQFQPTWKNYLEFNQVRGSLHATPKLSWSDELPGILNKLKWSENDFYMFSNGFYTNRAIFSTEALKVIAEGNKPKYNFVDNLRISSSEYKEFIKFIHGKLVVVIVFISITLALTSNQKKFLALVIVWNCLLIFYLINYVRFPLRVALPSFLLLSLSLLLFSEIPFFVLFQRKQLAKLKVVVFSFIFFIFVLAPLQGILYESRNNITNQQQYIAILEKLRQINPKGIFVVWGASLKYEDISPFVTSKDIPKVKLIGLGWRINSPSYQDQLKQLGINDLYEAIANREDTYFISMEALIPLYEQYMLEHYGKVVKLSSLLTIYSSNPARITKLYQNTSSRFPKELNNTSDRGNKEPI